MRRPLALLLLAALLAGCPDSSGPKTGPTQPADKKDDKPSAAALAAARAASFWDGAKEGSSVEYSKVTEVAGSKMEETFTQTLKAKTDAGYTLTTETMAGGNKIPGTDQTLSWIPDANAPRPAELGEEPVKIGADSYPCKHSKVESDGSTTELWTYKGLLLKSVTKGAANWSQVATKLDVKK